MNRAQPPVIAAEAAIHSLSQRKRAGVRVVVTPPYRSALEREPAD